MAKAPIPKIFPHFSQIPTKAQGRKPKKGNNDPVESLVAANALRIESQETNTHAPITLSKYNRYIQQGQKWIAQYTSAEKVQQDTKDTALVAGALANCSTESVDDNAYNDPEFRSALNKTPNRYSHRALGLFLTCKVFNEGCGRQTSDSIFSAFKHMWKNADGATYRGKWKFNREQQRWEGNPADSAEVEDVREAIKRHCSIDAGDRKHSVAMSKGYMDLIFKWSEKVCPQESYKEPPKTVEEQALRTKHAIVLAFFSTAWTIWSRNFETVGLRKKHVSNITTDLNSHDPPYFTIRLDNRKGYQNKLEKMKKDQDLRNSTYKIYDQPSLPSCNVFYWLPRWIAYLEKEHYQRPLEPNEFIFPALSVNGTIKWGEHASQENVQKWINEFTLNAGVEIGNSHTLSTHCFRRGGAQYRFMFAPSGQRWSLQTVRWWGGWAEGEQSNTLIRYLLDELSAYEHNCSSALNPIQSTSTDNMAKASLLSKANPTTPASSEELQTMHAMVVKMSMDLQTLRDDMAALLSTGLAQPIATQPLHYPQFPSPYERPPPPRHAANSQTGPSSHRMAPYTLRQPKCPLPKVIRVIPDIPLKDLNTGRSSPRSNSWREIVQHWLHPDPPRGLHVALKDWPQDWLSGDQRPVLGPKYFNWQVVALEFLEQYNGDTDKFLAAYPEANQSHSALLAAINAVRETRGERKSRGKEKGK